jgi:hypothetical protein
MPTNYLKAFEESEKVKAKMLAIIESIPDDRRKSKIKRAVQNFLSAWGWE